MSACDSGCAVDVSGGCESGGASTSGAVGSVVSSGGDGKWARRTEPPLFCDFLLSEDDFEIDRGMFGPRGCFGNVCRAVQKETGLDVAMNFPQSCVIQVNEHFVVKQAMLLVTCAHPLIVPLVGFGVSPSPFLATKLMRNGDLGHVLAQEFASKPPAGWDATAKSKCVFGIAAGMAFLHSKTIIHGDLKPGHILIDDDFEPVIGDFDLAADYNSERAAGGTYLFIAPEVFSGDACDQKADVYSFAVLLYHLFNQNATFEDGYKAERSFEFQVLRRTSNGERFARGDDIPDFYWDLICKCWSQDPEDRPSFVEIVEHLRSHTSEYALEGCDLSLVRAYENQVLASISEVLAAEN